MMKHQKTIAILFAMVFFIGSYFTRYDVPTTFNPNLKRELIPPQNMKYFTFGYNEVIADMFWIRYLQNIEKCETNCRLGWNYQLLESITTLSPKFRFAYRVGGNTLSVIVKDNEGAKLIMQKGILEFPTYTSLLQAYAYHLIFEMNDPQLAAQILTQAVEHGAPPWMLSFASRLYSKTGQKELARSVLLDFIDKYPDEAAKRQAAERLKQIETEIDSNSNTDTTTNRDSAIKK